MSRGHASNTSKGQGGTQTVIADVTWAGASDGRHGDGTVVGRLWIAARSHRRQGDRGSDRHGCRKRASWSPHDAGFRCLQVLAEQGKSVSILLRGSADIVHRGFVRGTDGQAATLTSRDLELRAEVDAEASGSGFRRSCSSWHGADGRFASGADARWTGGMIITQSGLVIGRQSRCLKDAIAAMLRDRATRFKYWRFGVEQRAHALLESLAIASTHVEISQAGSKTIDGGIVAWDLCGRQHGVLLLTGFFTGLAEQLEERGEGLVRCGVTGLGCGAVVIILWKFLLVMGVAVSVLSIGGDSGVQASCFVVMQMLTRVGWNTAKLIERNGSRTTKDLCFTNLTQLQRVLLIEVGRWLDTHLVHIDGPTLVEELQHELLFQGRELGALELAALVGRFEHDGTLGVSADLKVRMDADTLAHFVLDDHHAHVQNVHPHGDVLVRKGCGIRAQGLEGPAACMSTDVHAWADHVGSLDDLESLALREARTVHACKEEIHQELVIKADFARLLLG